MTPKSRANSTEMGSPSKRACALAPDAAASAASAAANTVTAGGADAEGARWSLEADLHSSFLRVSLVFADIHKIPRNHLK